MREQVTPRPQTRCDKTLMIPCHSNLNGLFFFFGEERDCCALSMRSRTSRALFAMIEQVLSPCSCATDPLYVCVLISSVKAERVPAKNSARKESSEDDSQSEPATSASPSGAIVRSQTEAGTR
jgi:hypothetical protein